MNDARLNLDEAKQIPSLDGVRGVAILLVLLFHFGILTFGWTGVDLFFILSAFLITQVLQSTKSRGFGAYIGRFYWRRFLRIVPLYFGYLAVISLVFLFTGKPSFLGAQLPWLATFSYNFYCGAVLIGGKEHLFHPLWSLSTEEQFYLVWPIIVWLLPRKGVVALAIAMFLAAPIIRANEYHLVQSLGISVGSEGRLVYNFPFGHIDLFACGALLALVRNGLWVTRPRLWAILLVFPALLHVIWQVLSSILQGHAFPQHLGFPTSDISLRFHIWGYGLGCLAFSGLMVIALYGNRENWVRRAMEWEPLRWMGKISFGLYILHWPILLLMMHFFPLSDSIFLRILQWQLFIGVAVTAAWLSYRYYESVFLRLKTRYFNSSNA